MLKLDWSKAHAALGWQPVLALPQALDYTLDWYQRESAGARARELREQPGMAPLPELRRRIGAELTDEEFLLRATMPAGQVDAMKAAGPAEQKYDPDMAPVMSLLRQLTKVRDISYLSVEKQGFRLELRGPSATVPA